MAVFGRAQHEYIKSGSGSAGRVNCPYVKTIARELKRRVRTDRVTERYYADWIAAHPYDRGNDWNFPASQEDPMPDEAFIREAAARNDKALFVIGRICGESYDCKPVRGDWYLSEAEERSIELLAKYFSRFAVVINSGNLTDLQWVGRYGVGAVVLVWQGGQEGAAVRPTFLPARLLRAADCPTLSPRGLTIILPTVISGAKRAISTERISTSGTAISKHSRPTACCILSDSD